MSLLDEARAWERRQLAERNGQPEGSWEGPPPEEEAVRSEYSLGELLDHFPAMRPPVIHGLLRQGETMNVIATSKTGKSWLVTDLILAVASGGTWLGTFNVEPGEVLVLDNELHGETLADRVRKVAEARGLDLKPLRDRITFKVLRGRLLDLFGLKDYFLRKPAGKFKLVVLDAFYRMLPEKVSENDNAQMAGVYNAVDRYADHLKACFVNVHHASKGSQAEKQVTDVGAGAGSMSRATDTHLVLRPHEEEGAFVLDVALRSFAPVRPRCLRWEFPLWVPADELDPVQLLRPEDRRKQERKAGREREDDGALLVQLDGLDADRNGYGTNRLRLALAWGHDRMTACVGRLLRDGILEPVPVRYISGKGAQKVCDGVRRRLAV
jgi:hypothetical protein